LSWKSPRASYSETSTRASTRWPFAGRQPSNCARLRNMTQRTWASASFSEK